MKPRRDRAIRDRGRRSAHSARRLYFRRLCESLCILLILMGLSAMAEDTNGPPMSAQDFFEGGTNTYNNWVELTTGGFLTHGDRAQAQSVQNWNNGGFGGISDLHLQDSVSLFTNTTVTLDGHGIYDQHNYAVKARLEQSGKWFLQLNANNFRTWSD